jgi:SET domain-containing protein
METEHGIVPGHAYSLLAAVEINIGNEVLRLCKIRNPWSNTEWKGNFRDDDPIWKKLGPEIR